MRVPAGWTVPFRDSWLAGLLDLALRHGGGAPILDLSREQITALAFNLGKQADARASAVDGIAFPVAEASSRVHHVRALCDGHASGDQPAQTPIAALLASVPVAKTQEAVELPTGFRIAEDPAEIASVLTRMTCCPG